MSKKSLLVLVTMSLLIFSVLLYAQGRQRGKQLTVDVVPILATFSFVDADGSGPIDPTAGDPFVIEGDIFKEGTSQRIGDFVCRGFFISQPDGDVTSVNQSFEIDGRGAIYVVGNEDGGVPGVSGLSRAIVGATGDFKGSGEAVIEPMPTGANPFIFRITFNFRD